MDGRLRFVAWLMEREKRHWAHPRGRAHST
jgi:hypothetical protein